jgi:hypothetical protein
VQVIGRRLARIATHVAACALAGCWQASPGPDQPAPGAGRPTDRRLPAVRDASAHEQPDAVRDTYPSADDLHHRPLHHGPRCSAASRCYPHPCFVLIRTRSVVPEQSGDATNKRPRISAQVSGRSPSATDGGAARPHVLGRQTPCDQVTADGGAPIRTPGTGWGSSGQPVPRTCQIAPRARRTHGHARVTHVAPALWAGRRSRARPHDSTYKADVGGFDSLRAHPGQSGSIGPSPRSQRKRERTDRRTPRCPVVACHERFRTGAWR